MQGDCQVDRSSTPLTSIAPLKSHVPCLITTADSHAEAYCKNYDKKAQLSLTNPRDAKAR